MTNSIAGLSTPVPTTTAKRDAGNTQRLQDAAQQFEALIISELLKTAREAGGSGGGWMGTEDEAGQTSIDMAEQQVAAVMAKAGGLGMRNFIVQGLQPKT